MPDTVERDNTTVAVLDDADDTIAVVVTVLNTVLALLASLDNSIILLTLLHVRSSPHTSTRVLWFSLGLADAGIALAVFLSAILGNNMFLSSIFIMCCCSSMMSTTCMSFDKMLSVARPFTYSLSRSSILLTYLIIIWVLSTAVTILEVVFFSPESYSKPPTSASLFHSSADCLVLSLVFPACTLMLLPCQLYLFIVARRHSRSIEQVKRSIAAKEISDNAFLSCTPTSAMMMGRISPSKLPMKSSRMKSYRSTLLLTTIIFLLSWTPYQVTLLFFTPSYHLLYICLLPLTAATFINPLMYAGQNKDVQEVIKKAYTRRKVMEMVDVATILPDVELSDPPVSAVCGDDKTVILTPVEWLLVIRLQVDKLGEYCSKVIVGEVEHSSDICKCSAPECEGTGV